MTSPDAAPRRFVAALLVLLAASCSRGDAKPPPAIEIGTPPTSSSAPRIDLATLPLTRTGAAGFTTWPKACDLLTDANLKAVLPQFRRATRTPGDTIITVSGGQFDHAKAKVPGAQCTAALALDGQRVSAEPGRFEVLVSVTAVGAPAFVRRNFASASDPLVRRSHGGECHAAQGGWVSCIKGPMAFTVQTTFPWQTGGAGERQTSRYAVAGRTREFTQRPGGSTGAQDRRDFEAAHITLPLAETVLARY